MTNPKFTKTVWGWEYRKELLTGCTLEIQIDENENMIVIACGGSSMSFPINQVNIDRLERI